MTDQTSTNNLPELAELVIVFSENHMQCLIDTPKLNEVGTLLQEAMQLYVEKGSKKLVMIDSISGKCCFWSHLVLGFYFRPAQKSLTEQFQRNLLDIAERQAKAAEKISDDCDHGENWKSE